MNSSIEYMVASSSASQSERTVEHRGESSGEGDEKYDEGGEVFRKIMVGLQDRILEPLEPLFPSSVGPKEGVTCSLVDARLYLSQLRGSRCRISGVMVSKRGGGRLLRNVGMIAEDARL